MEYFLFNTSYQVGALYGDISSAKAEGVGWQSENKKLFHIRSNFNKNFYTIISQG